MGYMSKLKTGYVLGHTVEGRENVETKDLTYKEILVAPSSPLSVFLLEPRIDEVRSSLRQ